MENGDERLAGSTGRIEIFTDGGCKPNPGPGGWGAVIRLVEEEQADSGLAREWFVSGNDRETTNNRMELQAAIAALGLLSGLELGCPVELYTDSEYLRQGITQWVNGWERNGWQTKGKEQVKNHGLWQNLARLAQNHKITWHWLKGHADHPHNERADQLATNARLALSERAVQRTMGRVRNAAWPEVSITVKASYTTPSGIGGWGVVIRMGEHTKTICKQEQDVTINALLVRGASEGLWALSKPCNVTIVSDADYLILGGSQWVKGWLNRGWHTRDGKQVANRAEWEALLAAMEPHHISWKSSRMDESADIELAGELAASAASGKIQSDSQVTMHERVDKEG